MFNYAKKDSYGTEEETELNKMLSAAVVLLMVSACSRLENRVMVTNDTDEVISEVTVTVCDLTWAIESLAPGETITYKAVYSTDGHFRVSSPELNGDFGYVTHGLTNDEVEITFREDRIDFRQSTGGY